MKFPALAAMLAGLAVTALSQRRPGPFWSLGGYGSVLFPATGHAPATPPGGVTGPYFSSWPKSPTWAKDSHPKAGMVIGAPVYDAGYPESGTYAPPEADQAPPALNSSMAPSVVLNQPSFSAQTIPTHYPSLKEVPSPCGNNSAESLEAPVPTEVGPTIYLLALKDHSVVQALGYWMQDGNLHYVSSTYSLNQISIDLIDLDLSQRLNDERGIKFEPPLLK